MILGDQVLLRPVEESDHPLIQRWQNEPEVWFWMGYERPFSLQDIADSEARAREEGQPFIIEADGHPIGRIGLNAFRPGDRRCSLYVFIGDPAAWGNGYGRDAILTMLGHAFDRSDLHLVQLWSLAGNDRAIATYEACGFVQDAILRQRSFRDGRWFDHIVMSVTRAEFEAARTRLDLGER